MSNSIIWLGSYNPRGFCNGKIVDKSGISPALCNHKGAEHAVTLNDKGLKLKEKIKKVKEFVKLRDEGKPMDKRKLRIRKLTPHECMRLMSFSDSDYEKIKSINSDSQIYKQCGNSIVVKCLEEIFKNLFFDEIKKCKDKQIHT